jgi:hypothetical protein
MCHRQGHEYPRNLPITTNEIHIELLQGAVPGHQSSIQDQARCNREIWEAAQNNSIAADAWFRFHNFTNHAQLVLKSKFGSVTNANGIVGLKALLFVMHGYAGLDWVPTDGSPLVQWGYRSSAETTLDPNQYRPVDLRTGTIGSLTHARDMPYRTYE